MKKYARVMRMDSLEKLVKNRGDFTGVILGHENCPQYYRQSHVPEMIGLAVGSGLDVKVNIPVIFEDFLDEFKEEACRTIDEYPQVKIFVNDWGMLVLSAWQIP